MRHKQNHPALANVTVDQDHTGQRTRTGAGVAAAGMTAGRDGVPPLLSVAAGIQSGVQPLQFMDCIHAGNLQLGNRAFLHWVSQLHAANMEPDSEETAAPDPQHPHPPPADTLPLQFGPKTRSKKKKKGAPVAEAKAAPESLPEAAPPAGAQAVPETQSTLPRAEPGSTPAPAGKKKKKKPRLTAMEKPEEAPVKTELSMREKDIIRCCYNGNAGRLRRGLSHRRIDVNIAVQDGTPLGIAVYYGHTAVVEALLSVPGINVNLTVQDGFTPLYIAVQEKHEEIVRLLLSERSINANMGISDKFAPLHIAVEKQEDKIIRLLLANPGINVNVRKRNGATPLLMAAQFNMPVIVEQLLKQGADANLGILAERSTPLLIAVMKNHLEVVRLLLQHPGTDVDHKTWDGATALYIASQEGHEEIAGLLLEKGADADTCDATGTCPLHLAVIYRHFAILTMLLDAGADICRSLTISGEKLTVYEVALLMGDRKITSMLDEYQARNPTRTDRFERLSPSLPAQGQAPEDEPVWSTPPTSPAPEWATPPSTPLPGWFPGSQPPPAATAPAAPPLTDSGETTPAPVPGSPAVTENPPGMKPATATVEPPPADVSGSRPGQAQASAPLAAVKDALINEVLGKLDNQTLEPLEGIMVMADVRAAANIDMLCLIYNRLAGMERERRRTRRQRPRRHRLLAAGAEPTPPHTTACRYALGDRTNLDADAAEVEIRKHLAQTCHRFISQALNDMEFGRGKPTSGYPGLLHASAGIPGVGSCSVFYHMDEGLGRIRIAGIGHHLDRETYQLDYAGGELRGRHTLHLS